MYQFISVRIKKRIFFFSKPKYLFFEGKMYTAKVQDGRMMWAIGKTKISYNQIKKSICQTKGI